MAKSKRKEPTQAQQQVYDNFLKSLFEGREKEILPYFLPDIEYLETLDIEAHRTTLRTDRVYKVMLEEHLHIVDVEFETGSHPNMEARLLDYHAYLYRKYRIASDLHHCVSVSNEDGHFPFAGGQWEAGTPDLSLSHASFMGVKGGTLSQRTCCSDLFVITNNGGSQYPALGKAIDEMIEYYQDDQTTLAQELRWMGIVLRRADTVPLVEKRQIEERLNMYDDLFEKDPKMQRIRAESKAEGRAEGEAEGEAKAKLKAKPKVKPRDYSWHWSR